MTKALMADTQNSNSLSFKAVCIAHAFDGQRFFFHGFLPVKANMEARRLQNFVANVEAILRQLH